MHLSNNVDHVLVAVMVIGAAYSIVRLAVKGRHSFLVGAQQVPIQDRATDELAGVHGHTRRDVDLCHGAMGISMVVMLVGRMSPFGAQLWSVGFACGVIWFAAAMPGAFAVRTVGTDSLPTDNVHGVAPRIWGAAYELSHALACGAMIIMLLAMQAGGTARAALLVIVAAIILADSAVHAFHGVFGMDGEFRPTQTSVLRGPASLLSARQSPVLCKFGMGVGMAVMLVAMA